MKIIIIEKDTRLAQSLKKNLESHGYSTLIFDSIEGAYEHVTKSPEHYALIIIDLAIPYENTAMASFFHSVRFMQASLPIIVLGHRDYIQHMMETLDIGANDYIVKPFSIAGIVSKIRSILRSYKWELIEVSNIKFDQKSRKAYFGNRELSLTPRELTILEYFMNHPNQVLSREAIFENVWEFDSEFTSNVVDVHIKNLRKKIWFGKKNHTIETVWGSGYRFLRKK